jgi:hypothetical protein
MKKLLPIVFAALWLGLAAGVYVLTMPGKVHAQIKVSQLPPAPTLNGSEVFPCVQSLTTYGCLTSQLVPLFRNIPAPPVSSNTSLAVTTNGAIAVSATTTQAGDIAFYAGGPAATKLQAFQFNQVGQGYWTLFQDASTGDMNWYSSSAGHVAMAFSSAGGVTFAAPTTGPTITVTGAANSYATTISANSTASQAFGVQIFGGTNSSDLAISVINATNTTTLFRVFGDGGVVIGNPTGGDKGPGTLNVQGPLYVNGTAVTVP